MEIPTTVSGVLSTSIALYEPPPKVKRPGTGNSTKTDSSSYSEMVADEEAKLVTDLAAGQVLGNTVAQTAHLRDYWGQDELQMSINGSKGFYLPADHGYTVNADSVPPKTDITTEQFWKSVTTNPNKSVRDYNEKFDHNMPMPIVANGELVYTVEGPKVYVMLLARLIYFGERDLIHHDSGDLLRLIVDHMQLFERHWRKMVVDIRNGTLNRHCNVSAQDRTEFESSNLPRPKIAKTLDDTFRKLGFHMKVLGKDITEKPFAEKKAPKHPPPTFEERGGVEESLLQFRLKGRRLSTPIESMEGMLLSEQRAETGVSPEFDGTASMGWEASRGSSRGALASSGRVRPADRVSSPSELSLLSAISRGGSRPTSRQVSTRGPSRDGAQTASQQLSHSLKPLSPNKSKKVSFLPADTDLDGSGQFEGLSAENLLLRDRLGTAGSASSTAPRRIPLESRASASTLLPVSDHSKTKGPSMSALVKTVGSELLERMTEYEESTKIRGPSRRVPSKTDPKLTRRGSETDILRPAIAEDLHDLSYKLETDARSKYDRLVKSGERFLCPFPSCGESFTSMQATFDHLKEHEQKTMLFGSAPGQDSHMHFYWPKDAPWREPEWFNKKGIAAGSVGCPHCDEAFATKDKLDIHVRLNHNKKPPKELPRHIEVVGKPTTHVPDGVAFLDQCVRHLYFVKDCRDCVRCELSEGVPKPKFKFYKSIRINFTVLKGSGGSTVIAVGDESKGVYIKLPLNPLENMSSASFSSDGGDNFESPSPSKKKPPKGIRGLVRGIVVDAEKDPWVCIDRLLTAKEARAEGVAITRLFDHDYELLPVGTQNTWYRAADITDRFNVTYCSKIEFKKRMKNGEIPSENIFFVRTEDPNSL